MLQLLSGTARCCYRASKRSFHSQLHLPAVLFQKSQPRNSTNLVVSRFLEELQVLRVQTVNLKTLEIYKQDLDRLLCYAGPKHVGWICYGVVRVWFMSRFIN